MQRQGCTIIARRATRFNPYRVFKFVATQPVSCSGPSRSAFQSLSGFQVRCNSSETLRPSGIGPCFNPYRVFKFVATDEVLLNAGPVTCVSIPIGFSSSLQQSPWPTAEPCMVRFQSLSGFQVRCNKSQPKVDATVSRGFNPYRVFKFVATCLDIAFYRHAVLFQSLSGFQVRCNGFRRSANGPRRDGFNPYRVFKFVATRRAGCGRKVSAEVSIPIGFSSSLQRHTESCSPL